MISKQTNFHFMSFTDMISETMDKEFVQCLVILLSCVASWSDRSERIRYWILSTELLIHVANVISFFVDLSDSSEPVRLHVHIQKNLLTILIFVGFKGHGP